MTVVRVLGSKLLLYHFGIKAVIISKYHGALIEPVYPIKEPAFLSPWWFKIAAFTKQEKMRVFSWQFSHLDAEQAKELLPDCAEKDLPTTRTPDYHGEKVLPCAIDFSHPKAEELLESQWHDRIDAGFDGSMVDFGEIIPDEAVFYDGRTGDEMHNAYALDYTKAYRKLFEKYRGEDHVLFSRSAAAGVQKYSCQFGGDQLSSFRGLTYSINGGLTLAASGFPFWGVVAGGYSGFADEETYLRWTDLQLFHRLCDSME